MVLGSFNILLIVVLKDRGILTHNNGVSSAGVDEKLYDLHDFYSFFLLNYLMPLLEFNNV